MVRLSPKDKLAVGKLVDNISPALLYVHSRWVNARAREGMDDYAKIIEDELPEGFFLVRMTKSPFGFRFLLQDVPNTTFSVRVTSRGITWRYYSFIFQPQPTCVS